MKPLWNADVLLSQVGFAAEANWRHILEERGEESEDPPPFDVALNILENRIDNTHAIIQDSEEPVMYFSSDSNFRDGISTTGYKRRSGGKPFHYHNIKAVLNLRYETVEKEGLEADDLLAIEQSKRDNTIIITIDKDLLQVEGWHYMYEFGNVPSFGPYEVKGYGKIWFEGNKFRGYGLKFFLAQCIMGDSVDSIVGVPRKGPRAAYNLLSDTDTYEEGLEAVVGAYKDHYGDEGEDKLVENGRLLWLTRELDEEGKPVLWDLDYIK